jgi:uncharacterized alkaline shock family protein YloU
MQFALESYSQIARQVGSQVKSMLGLSWLIVNVILRHPWRKKQNRSIK